MKNCIALLLVGAASSLVGCTDDKHPAATNAVTPPLAINSAALQKDFDTWWNYTYHNVRLSEDFVGLDVDSTVLKKADFLYRLTSGRVVPFKLMDRDGVSYYKLYPVSEDQPDIKATIKQKAAVEVDHFNMEGQPLPDYQFTDIKGRTYSPATTKGKLVVLKLWYIGCVACVQEFPAVNKLVESYQGREDILFISLARDGKEELVGFLKPNRLKYATVPSMKDFMQEKLKINSYPTHILVDRAGKMVKVVDRIEELTPFLEKQAGM